MRNLGLHNFESTSTSKEEQKDGTTAKTPEKGSKASSQESSGAVGVGPFILGESEKLVKRILKGDFIDMADLLKDQRLHPIAYASRALSPVEQRYSITELETLAVVWTISHFHHYLYGNSVTIFTDHTAVKAVLETANPTAKHARWWTRVYGRGVKDVKIVYRPGRENSNADALSRHPLLPAPAIGIAEDEMRVKDRLP